MTEQEMEQIVTEITNRIIRNSVGIDEVPVVETTQNINTLPCSTADGTIVLVKVDVLSKPAREAASTANSAALAANSAAQAAGTATLNMTELFGVVKRGALTAIDKCSDATDKALEASNNIGNKKILVVTEDLYAALLNGETIVVDDVLYVMDSNTLYFATES